MQCVQQRFSKVGIFLLGLLGALVGAFILSPSAHAQGEYYQYIPSDNSVRVTGGVLATPAGLKCSGQTTCTGGVSVKPEYSRLEQKPNWDAAGGGICHYTLILTSDENFKAPVANGGGHNGTIDMPNDQGVGDDNGDKGCKHGDMTISIGQSIVKDTFTNPVTVNSVPDPTAGACPGSNAPAGTDCNTIPAGCPGSPKPAPSTPPDLTKCPFQKVASGEEAPEPDNCPIDKDTALRWIFCPIVELGRVITNGLDMFIDTYLQTSNDIFRNDTVGTSPSTGATGSITNSYKKAWETFRTFGVSLIIIAGLVMVASEALNLGIVDAYTIRKVLPRLVVAVIGVSLSWDLMDFLTTFFDSLGHAAGSVIYTSFSVDPVKGVDIGTLISGPLLATIGGLAGAILLGPLGIISLLTTLILGMLIGVAVLIARQAIIAACVIMAPLAIAAYILPNTNKLANFWWNTYVSMMLLYPIATGLIALCKSMGNLAVASHQAFSGIVGIIFFFAGYALLPAAFRLSGGLIATIGGIANDKSRGGFDRLKKGRQQRMAGNAQDLKDGRRFRGRNPVSTRLNRVSGGVGAFAGAEDKIGFFRGGERGKQARQEAFANHRAEAGARYAESTAGKLARFKDHARRAQTYRTEQEARTGLKRDYLEQAAAEGKDITDAAVIAKAEADTETGIAAAKANGGFSATLQQTAAKQLAASGTGMMSLSHAAQVIERASGGNESLREELVGDIRSSSKSATRFDIGGMGHKTLSDLAASTAGGNVAPSRENVRAALVEAGRSTDNATLVRGKPTSTKAITAALSETLDENMREATTTVDPARKQAALASAGQTAAKLRNIEQATAYGPETTTEAIETGVGGPTGAQVAEANARTIRNVASPRVGMTTTDRAGNIVNVVAPDGSQPLMNNPDYDPSARTLNRDEQRSFRDPNDPRNTT